MWHDYAPDNPFRSPEWRWNRALLAVSGVLPVSRRRDDSWTRRAIQFAIALEQAVEPQAVALLCDRDRALFFAHRIWQAKTMAGVDVGRRAYAHCLDARLLARQPVDELVRRTGMTADALSAYQAVFFDLRNRFEQRDVIVNLIIGSQIHHGANHRDPFLFYKLWSYFGGPRVADWLLAGQKILPAPTCDEQVDGYFDSIVAGNIRTAVLKASKYINPGDTMIQSDLLATYQKMLEFERTTIGMSKSAMSFVLEGAQSVLGSIRMSVASHEASNKSDTDSAELRGDELISMALTDKMAKPDIASNFVYPAPGGAEAVP